ncbi:MAG: hypothetical protein PWP15_393 [Methanothermococcus sp.]|jgi:hypothetical protein|nr:hypothetical protein [Methanothermococcus sp.]MDK2987353.1 hypothetical protein [Methanothermococcus sp.]
MIGVSVKFIEFGHGTSNDDNPLKAGAHATSDALKYLDEYAEKSKVAFLFSSPDYDPEEILNGVKLILGNKTPIVGGTSKFGITNNDMVEDGVSVGILASKYFNVGLGVGLGVSINPRESGRRAAHDAIENLGMMPKLMMVFMDYCKFEEDVLKGIVDIIGITTPIFGGTTSDDFEFKKTYQYCNDVYFDSVVCAAFGGDILPKISFGSYSNISSYVTKESQISSKSKILTQGYEHKENLKMDLGGKEDKTIVTETNKRYVYTLNNIDAIEYYNDISNFRGSNEDLRKNRSFYLSHPFGVINSDGEIYLKGPISIKNDMLVFGSNIMKDNELKLVDIDNKTIESLFKKPIDLILNTPPKYSPFVTFCCISAFLPEVSKDAVENSLKECPLNPMFGFTSYGEIIFKEYMNYTVSMCSIIPDLISISAKEGIHMITKHPATKETILKINDMGGSAKIDELAKELGIHRRTAYDRVEPLLQYGFVEKNHAMVKITEFGKLLLKFGFK